MELRNLFSFPRHHERRILRQTEGSGIFSVQVKSDSFLEIPYDLIHSPTLGGHGDLHALRDVTGFLPGPDKGFDRMLKGFHSSAPV